MRPTDKNRGARLHLTLGLLSVLAFLGGCRPAGEAPTLEAGEIPPPPQASVDVQHYAVEVTLPDLEVPLRLQGRVALTVEHGALPALRLDAAPGLRVDTAQVNGAQVTPRREGAHLWIPLPSYPPGTYVDTVYVAYQGAVDEGLYRAPYADQAIVYTDAWPLRARGWLPAVHHPSDPATLSLHLDLPDGVEAVATGTPVDTTRTSGRVRYRWQLSASAPTYTYAFAVAEDFQEQTFEADNLLVRHYALDQARVDTLDTEAMLAFFTQRIGPYAFGRYETVQVPIPWLGMEQAATSFINAEALSQGRARETLVHELVHQWFGNRVTLADWSDLWLSEGFATYLTTLYIEAADGRDAARRRWVQLAAYGPTRQATHTALVPADPVDPVAHLTWVPYEKGAAVLHLLRLTLGEAAFDRLLRTTYETYAGQALSTSAFQQLAEAEAGRSLATLFGVWVYGQDVPVLRAVWSTAERRLDWSVVGDAGTLDDLPWELEVTQGQRRLYVPASAGHVVLPGSAPPEVRPVGILLDVQGPG
ncbi:MAG: M1 family aminopeptidase [Bacteroidota bacterium]